VAETNFGENKKKPGCDSQAFLKTAMMSARKPQSGLTDRVRVTRQLAAGGLNLATTPSSGLKVCLARLV
jgi:hypothetical protein